MDKTTNILLSVLIVLGGIGSFGLYRSVSPVVVPAPTVNVPSPNLSGITSLAKFSATSVSTTNIGATLTQVLGSNPNRVYFSIQNQSAVPIFCLLDGATVAASSSATSTVTREVGFRIAATSTNAQGSFYQNSGYVGVVNCTASANTTSTVTEG